MNQIVVLNAGGQYCHLIARSIRELQLTELIIAPTIKTEGKVFQQAQKLGRPR